MLLKPEKMSQSDLMIPLAMLNGRYERMRGRPEDISAGRPFSIATPFFDIMSRYPSRTVAANLTRNAWRAFEEMIDDRLWKEERPFSTLNQGWNELAEAVQECAIPQCRLQHRLLEVAKVSLHALI